MLMMIDLMGMGKKRARDVRDLKRMLLDLDEKKRKLEEIGRQKVEEEQMKTIVVMMLDEETRKHTVAAQKGDHKLLRYAVDDFVGAVAAGMERLEGKQAVGGQEAEEGTWSWGTGNVDDD
jgi:hypothetical protein